MSISSELRELVRQRSNFACEYCEVTESDSGGELTIDHFQPQSKGGSDDIENLIYVCIRCNQHKLDYWPSLPDGIPLWNPRTEPRTQHFLEVDDGVLHPITSVGVFTIHRLHLNRPLLVVYRQRRRREETKAHALLQYQELLRLQEQLQNQVIGIIREQQKIIDEQRALLDLLLKSFD